MKFVDSDYEEQDRPESDREASAESAAEASLAARVRSILLRARSRTLRRDSGMEHRRPSDRGKADG